MSKLPISVCIISGAEAHRVGKTLESVADWVSEIVVVLDARAQDGTEKVVEQYGGKVFREPWKGFIGQKQSAAVKCSQPWLLNLDADEVVSQALREEIHGLFATQRVLEAHAAYRVGW
jgi:glycosyltransferase involved in cell wall biosynthesis